MRLKRCIYATQRDTLPPITTHNVVDDASDPVLNSFRRCKLFNETSDRVKVCIDEYPIIKSHLRIVRCINNISYKY